MAGAAALLTRTGASEAAFGDAANVFGRCELCPLNVTRLVALLAYGIVVAIVSCLSLLSSLQHSDRLGKQRMCTEL